MLKLRQNIAIATNNDESMANKDLEERYRVTKYDSRFAKHHKFIIIYGI